MDVKVRRARQDELKWVNRRYDEVDFVHSNFENEVIAIAEIGSENAGLGRLVKIDVNSWELGGMYVFEKFRGRGVAKEVLCFLLAQSDGSTDIYCLPFSHLSGFYKKHGFSECENPENAPEEIVKKWHWCNETYSHKVLLFWRSSDEAKNLQKA